MRSESDYNHERDGIDLAHAQNDAGRDAFVGLVHTALFAASIAFVGDVAPLKDAVLKPALLAAWFFNFVGLLALTISFQAARCAANKRRSALNDPTPPSTRGVDVLNGVSLWTFPVSLLCLFSFTIANVVQTNDRQKPSTTATVVPGHRSPGLDATAPRPRVPGSNADPASSRPTDPARSTREHLIAESKAR